jgi:hypothetical protein
LIIITYTCEPTSPTEEALAFLASWSSREASADATGAEPAPSTPDES